MTIKGPAPNSTINAIAGALEREAERVDDRARWLLSAPAIALIVLFGAGPLMVMALYSFLAPGDYGNVKW
ncbi:MAG: hypothetical protein AAF192_11950, partial [Pseudomonadota bacterium]